MPELWEQKKILRNPGVTQPCSLERPTHVLIVYSLLYPPGAYKAEGRQCPSQELSRVVFDGSHPRSSTGQQCPANSLVTRLPRPWDSPGKNTGVGCHFLLQCMKVKRESEVAQSCLTLSDPMDCSLPGSSVHGIFQAGVLEWDAIAFSGS